MMHFSSNGIWSSKLAFKAEETKDSKSSIWKKRVSNKRYYVKALGLWWVNAFLLNST